MVITFDLSPQVFTVSVVFFFFLLLQEDTENDDQGDAMDFSEPQRPAKEKRIDL